MKLQAARQAAADGDVATAFQQLLAGAGMAADASGMPLEQGKQQTSASPQPFFVQSVSPNKRTVCSTKGTHTGSNWSGSAIIWCMLSGKPTDVYSQLGCLRT